MAVDFGREDALATQLLKELKSQSSHWAASGAEFGAWKNKVLALIRRVYGDESQQETDFQKLTFYSTYASYLNRNAPTYDRRLQKEFLNMLPKAIGSMAALVQDLKMRAPSAHSAGIPASVGGPAVFVAHGGKSVALSKVKEFLVALGCNPIIAEDKPSEGRSVNGQVEWCMSKSDCAVILATKGDIDGKTGDWIPRSNVVHEVGKCQERFPGKLIYLLEEGTRFPSNIAEKVWERFTQDNMERAFLKIAKELVAFGFLRAERKG